MHVSGFAQKLAIALGFRSSAGSIRVLSFQLALAHVAVTVGDYESECGWLDEPMIAGHRMRWS